MFFMEGMDSNCFFFILIIFVVSMEMKLKMYKNFVLLHCRTLTTPVSLLRCLKSIKEYAFVKSPYPVIITLEDHLTPDLQAKVAEVPLLFIANLFFLINYCSTGFSFNHASLADGYSNIW